MPYNNKFIDIAEQLKPTLIPSTVKPIARGQLAKDSSSLFSWTIVADNAENTASSDFICRNGQVAFDFGRYCVGYLSFELECEGKIDCPLRLQIKFGETIAELGESFDGFEPSLGRAWLQDEVIVIDYPVGEVKLPRRYAFRYVSITSVYNPPSYKFRITNLKCETVTSADETAIPVLSGNIPEQLRDIDRTSLNTLRHCMQTVFEDGPKRDRRLWLGDFRLQALVNYQSFKNYDLCKRCLYLFAGTADERGCIPSCVYEYPQPRSGELFIYDYTALFVPTLLEYAEASKDIDTAVELWPSALRQLEIVLKDVDSNGLFHDKKEWWLFIDWNNGLDKQASEQAIVIYCLKQALKLAELVGDSSRNSWLHTNINLMSKAAMESLFDSARQVFISGESRQISWASQAWMIIAGVVDYSVASEILSRLEGLEGVVQPAGPYLYHYVLEAMFIAGHKEQAIALIKEYWGGMINLGSDTFWEVFDPNDLKLSPYGSYLINSYCHAWSCTPSLFIRQLE